MFKKLISWISRSLSEDNGTPSSLRVSVWVHDFFIAVCLVAIVITAIVLVAKGLKDYVAVLVPVFWAVLSWLGVNRTSKVVQKGMESPIPTPPESPQ